MTRNTYRVLAEDIGKLLAHYGDEIPPWRLLDVLCVSLKADNSRFDGEIFFKAIRQAEQNYLRQIDADTLQRLTNMIVAGNG